MRRNDRILKMCKACVRVAIVGCALWGLQQPAEASPFGAEVVSCVPAPGQFINSPVFNEPFTTLGPPSGGGTAAPDHSSVLSLGGFGGSIVIRFDQTVSDDPGNYLGLDFIVFGNASWVSNDPQRRWAEPAHIEVMRDVDSDGLPGSCAEEVWYLIPGSLTSIPTDWRTQTWDSVAGGPFPPASVSWFPQVGVYPYLPEGPSIIPLDADSRYTTAAHEVSAGVYADPSGQGGTLGVLVNPHLADGDSANDEFEGVFGYADLSPTLRLGDTDADNIVDDPAADPADFYTVPDNPARVGVTPGSGGGDAFEISDALDPVTGLPADLSGIDFVRITSAVDAVFGPLGEVSPEIDAVADVAPIPCPGDLDGDHRVDLVDLLRLRNRLGIEDPQPGFSVAGDTVQDGVHDLADLAILRARLLGAICD